MKNSTTSILSLLIGSFAGLIIANQSIKAILYVNLVYVFFGGLVFTVFSLLLVKSERKKMVSLNKWDLVFLISGGGCLIYAVLSLLVEERYSSFGLVVELLVLFFMFYVGKIITAEAIRVVILLIILIGSVHSILILNARSYVYSSGVNYLLMSLMIGLFSCLSYIRVFFVNEFYKKAFFAVLATIGLFALINMQSRATFVFVVFFLALSPLLILEKKSLFKYLMLSLSVLTSIAIFFWPFLLEFYELSLISNRMKALYDIQNEPRYEIYGAYFQHFSEFWFSGYGLGGTEQNIYSNLVDKYPHNFILEFYSEFGVIGLFFSSYLFLFTLIRSRVFIKLGFLGLSCFVIYAFYLMNFMKSFSIYDSSVLFFSFGLMFNESLIRFLKYEKYRS